MSVFVLKSGTGDQVLKCNNLLFLSVEVYVKFLSVTLNTGLLLLDSTVDLVVEGTSTLLELNGDTFEFLLESQKLRLASRVILLLEFD